MRGQGGDGWSYGDGSYVDHSALAPVIRGEVDTPDRLGNFEEMGVLPQGETRPSRKERDRVISQINEAEAQERLTPEQGEARREAATRVERRSDFKHITRDLPPAPPGPRSDTTKSNPVHLLAIGVFQFCLGAMMLGADVSAVRHTWAAWFIGTLSYLLLIVGAAMAVNAGQRLHRE